MYGTAISVIDSGGSATRGITGGGETISLGWMAISCRENSGQVFIAEHLERVLAVALLCAHREPSLYRTEPFPKGLAH